MRWEETLSNLDTPLKIEPVSGNSYQMKPLKNALLHLKIAFPFLNGIVLVRNVYRAWQHRVSKNNEW